jgi:hypothetical protein
MTRESLVVHQARSAKSAHQKHFKIKHQQNARIVPLVGTKLMKVRRHVSALIGKPKKLATKKMTCI